MPCPSLGGRSVPVPTISPPLRLSFLSVTLPVSARFQRHLATHSPRSSSIQRCVPVFWQRLLSRCIGGIPESACTWGLNVLSGRRLSVDWGHHLLVAPYLLAAVFAPAVEVLGTLTLTVGSALSRSPWKAFFAQEQLHIPSTFLWFRFDCPPHLRSSWGSNGVVMCALACSEDTQADVFSPPTFSSSSTRIFASPHHIPSERCNHSSEASAYSSLEWSSSIRVCLKPVDCCWSVLDQPCQHFVVL